MGMDFFYKRIAGLLLVLHLFAFSGLPGILFYCAPGCCADSSSPVSGALKLKSCCQQVEKISSCCSFAGATAITSTAESGRQSKIYDCNCPQPVDSEKATLSQSGFTNRYLYENLSFPVFIQAFFTFSGNIVRSNFSCYSLLRRSDFLRFLHTVILRQ
jgi:hypothetical protein